MIFNGDNMGEEIQYECDKCGFIISNSDLNYFIDEETKVLEVMHIT